MHNNIFVILKKYLVFGEEREKLKREALEEWYNRILEKVDTDGYVFCAFSDGNRCYEMYEYFKETIEVTAKSLELLFNYILDKKCFPRSWSMGSIIPVYKKGDPTDSNNYRGITLVSCFAQLFTTIFNERLQKWTDENDILTDAQFGF